MAIETEQEVRARLAQIAPGAVVTSTRRTPERNAAVGGVPNSLHTREGEDGGARALDIIPGESGLSMAQLNARLASSGLNFQERLNEGDHVHVGIDGRRRDPNVGPLPQSSYRVVAEQELAETDTPESLAAAGYQLDPTTNRYFRVVGQENAALPEPLDNSYAERQADRENLALDQEESEILQASMVPEGVVNDVAKGVFLEGGQAVVSGVKRGFNATMDLIDEAGDWIETHVPGTIMWEGFDGDASTPMSIRLTTQDKAQARLEAAQGGTTTWLQRLGMAQLRAPTSEAERPETVTGRIIEGVTQFGTGFVGGGKVLQGWKAAGTAGRIGKNLVQGALADFTAFDGQEARLSNLLAEYAPDALAPALNWLAASPEDGEVEGRFKNVVEGGILGGAVDVLGVGIRRLRAAREVRTAARDAARAEGLQIDPTLAQAEAAVRGEELQTAVREALGNPEGPRFRVKVDAAERTTRGAPADLSATVARGEPTDNVFDINLARIETPEDVQAVITGMADRFAKDADLARRGTRSWEQTRASSDGIDWVTSMAERKVGDAANSDTVLAYRSALNASATTLLDLARKVEAEPTLANQYAFRRATAVHSAIQNEFMGARAEAGRALNAFKIPAGAPETYLRQVDSLIADIGGANSAQELASHILRAARNGDVALNQMVKGGWAAHSRDLVKLYWTNSLLSGLGTPLINIAGNGMMIGLNMASRSLAPRMAKAFGGNATTQVGEAAALAHGYQQAFRDLFRLNPMQAAERIGANGGEALRREGIFRGMAPGIDDAAPQGIAMRAGREEAGMNTSRPMSAGAWRVAEDTPLGRVLDIMQMVMEAPSNLNALTDDAFKTIAARGELHSQAFRKVATEGLEGEAARARYADLITNPTDDMLKAAEREMHDLTFTRDIGPAQFKGEAERPSKTIAQSFSDARSAMDSAGPFPFGTFTMPFLRTPANLVSVGLRYSPLAPFSRRVRNDLAAGGARAETAKAQIALGTALWSVWAGMAMDGQITGAGPGNRGQREAMQRVDEYGGTVFQPYSVRFGDRWFSFERADPMGQAMGMIADMADLAKNGDWDSDRNGEMDELVAHGVQALGQAFFGKTSLQGVTEITSALLDGTTADALQLVQRWASSAVPFSSANRMVRRGEDPYMREVWDAASSMRNTIPGLSDELPAQRDLWGRARTYQTGLGQQYDAILPIQTREVGGSAIDLEILNNGVSVTMPGRSIEVMGESVSLKNRPDIYSEFVQLAGEPAFEHLNAVAEGRHPDSEFYFSLEGGPGGGKAEYIKDVIRAYRSDARAQILDRYASELQGMAAERVRRREEVRLDQ